MNAIALTTATLVASIGMLTQPDMYGDRGDTLLVCVAVLATVASLATSSLDYATRSRDMFSNYRKLQSLSVEAERQKDRTDLSQGEVDDLYARYDSLLDESENHTSGDHFRVLGGRSRWRLEVLREDATTLVPYVALAVPVLLVVPLLRELWP